MQEEELPGAEETEEQREENSSENLLLIAEAEQLLSQIRALDPGYGEALPPGYRRTESDIRDLRAMLQRLQAQRSCSVDQNKLNHIFGKAAHNLDPLVQQYGSQSAAFNAIEQALNNQLGPGTGPYSTVVNVGGTNVTVTGTYVNGAPRIGTA